MPVVPVARLSALPPNTAIEVTVEGKPYAICNVDGKVYALDGYCPHAGGPLGEGQIRNGRLVCPIHLWQFDCATGACVFVPTMRAATFEVRVEGDEIAIQVP